ncbi:MAG: thiol reductant ABC exporter subunit CydC [Eggerthellaceae bacterium]|nr:thiol reductant ABC exporter subunit CydC [Eggerthellaceae bacterium]
MFDKRLLQMAPEARKYIIASVGLQWLALLANIGFVLTVGIIVQSFLTGVAPIAWQAFLVATAIVVVAVRVAALSLAQRAGLKAALVAKREVRAQIYHKLVQMGPAYTERISTAEAVQVCVEGTEQLEGYFGAYLPQLFYSALAPVTLFVCLAPLCWPAALALLICVPLIPASIVAIQKIAKRVMGDYWNSYTDLGQTFLENLQGLTTLKIFQADAARHEAMNREAERFRRATMRLLSMQLNSVTAMDLFAFGGAAVGVIVVAVNFASGAIPFFAAFTVLFLSAEFFLPLRALGSYFHTAMGGMAVAQKMYRILDAPCPARGSRVIGEGDSSLVCRDLGYSYDGERQVLQGVEFCAPTGSFVGIVGESGSGKSTLAGILSGRLAGFSGTVTVGGVPIQEASPAALAGTVTVVPFSSYLFKGTARSNLQMANPQASDEDLWAALEKCRVDGFVRELGDLDAEIAEEGKNLSGGQRQRIALARAILHDTPAYIFDEATSNVDAESEHAIIETIHELAKTKTVVMISHRLSAVAGADEIFVMENGRLAEHGPHDQLLAANGAYARLWNQQASLEALADSADANQEIDEQACAPDIREERSQEELTECPACPLKEEPPCISRQKCCHPERSANAHTPCHPERSAKRGVEGSPSLSHFAVMLGLLDMVKPLLGWMVLAVVLGVLGFAAAIFLTVFGMYALMDAIGYSTGIAFTTALVLVGVCGVLRGPLRYGEQMCNHYLAFKLLALVRDKVFGALRRLAPAKLEGRDKGDLVSLVTADIELLEVFYAHTLSPVVIAVLVSAGMVAFFASISAPLAWVALISYLVVGALLPWIGSKASGSSGRVLREGIASLNAFVLDSLRGLRETLQFGRAAERSAQLTERMRAHAEVERAQKSRTALFMASTSGVVLALDVLMILVAGALVFAGHLSGAGALVAITAFMSSFGPVIAVANLGTTLQQTLASGARVLELLREEPQTPEVTDGLELDSFDGAGAHGVDFSYGDVPVLHNVTLAVEPGEVVQIAGRSGSGKSTLCKLLLRFWDATRGMVDISGRDIRQVNTASLRACEGCMTQDTHLFVGTLAENILIAKPDATEEELAAACEKAALGDFLARLPQGLNTPVGELGDTLSGGERQRIGLARMFLHDAPFMLLDEPTSNLDSLNEAAVLQALREAKGNRTVLLVSHRPSTAALADRIITVDHGRIS